MFAGKYPQLSNMDVANMAPLPDCWLHRVWREESN